MKQILGIGLIILIIAGLGIVVQRQRSKPFDSEQPPFPPTIAPTSIPTSQNCKPNELEALAEFEGAAGSVYGTFSIKNISNRNCTVVGENQIQLHYDSTINSIKVNTDQPTTQTEYTLEPGQILSATAQIQNGPQCSTGISPVKVTYNYYLPNEQKLVFKDSTGQENFTINACSSDKDITQVDMKSLSVSQ